MVKKWVKILNPDGLMIVEGELISEIELRDGSQVTFTIKQYPTICDLCDPPKTFKSHGWWKAHMRRVHNLEVD